MGDAEEVEQATELLLHALATDMGIHRDDLHPTTIHIVKMAMRTAWKKGMTHGWKLGRAARLRSESPPDVFPLPKKDK